MGRLAPLPPGGRRESCRRPPLVPLARAGAGARARRGVLFVGLAGALALAAAVSLAPRPAAAASRPRLLVTPAVTTVGGRVLVDAVGFPPDVDVAVQLCGDDGYEDSAGCAQQTTVTAATSQYGHFAQYLTIAYPPVPCPCVVQAQSPALPGPVDAPITVQGVALGPVTQPSSASLYLGLRVLRASVSGNGPWYSWFGGLPVREFRLTLENLSTTPLPVPPLVLLVGSSRTPHQLVGVPSLGVLGAGATKTYSIPVRFGILAAGSFYVRAYLAGVVPLRSVVVATSMFPWGAFGVVVLLVVLLLAYLAWRVYDRRSAKRARQRLNKESFEVVSRHLQRAPAAGAAQGTSGAPGSGAGRPATGTPARGEDPVDAPWLDAGLSGVPVPAGGVPLGPPAPREKTAAPPSAAPRPSAPTPSAPGAGADVPTAGPVAPPAGGDDREGESPPAGPPTPTS